MLKKLKIDIINLNDEEEPLDSYEICYSYDTKESINKNSIGKIIDILNRINDNIKDQNLPEVIGLTIELEYFDEKTPIGFNPPFFQSVYRSTSNFKKIRLGEVNGESYSATVLHNIESVVISKSPPKFVISTQEISCFYNPKKDPEWTPNTKGKKKKRNGKKKNL